MQYPFLSIKFQIVASSAEIDVVNRELKKRFLPLSKTQLLQQPKCWVETKQNEFAIQTIYLTPFGALALCFADRQPFR